MKIILDKGDTIYTGRFKNQKTIIKKFGRDKNGQPTINNGRKVLGFRVAKFMHPDFKLKEEIEQLVLQEYHGPNFVEPLLDKLDALDKELNNVHKKILKNKFVKTTVDRDFKYVEEFLKKATKYAKLAAKAVDDVRT